MTKSNLAEKLDEQPAPKTRPPQAERSRFTDVGHVHRHHHYTLRKDQPYQTALAPGFFKSVARNCLGLGDWVELTSDSQDVWALLLVTVSEPAQDYCEVVELVKRDLTPVEVQPQAYGPYVASWTGPGEKWLIKRTADGVTLGKGIASRDAALDEMMRMAPRKV